jgi:hypothetical protein
MLRRQKKTQSDCGYVILTDDMSRAPSDFLGGVYARQLQGRRIRTLLVEPSIAIAREI